MRNAALGVATGAALLIPGMIAAPAALAAETPIPAPTQGTTASAPSTKAATTTALTPAPQPSVAPKPGIAVRPQTAPAPPPSAPALATPAPTKPAPLTAAVAPVKAAALHSLSSTISDRTVTVSGFGFEPNETLTLTLNRSDGLSIPATLQATLAGTVAFTINATDAASGFYTLTATGTTSTAVSTTFELLKVYTYAPTATATPAVKVGQHFLVSGTGWTKGPVTVTQSGSNQAQGVNTGLDGTFSVFVTPQTVRTVTITITDGITTKTVAATAEAYTPAVNPEVSAVAEQDKIIVHGTGFVPNSTVTFDLTPWPAFTFGPGFQMTSDANGDITASFTVPSNSDLPVGTKMTITATGDYSTTASTLVTIIDNVHPNAELGAVAPVEQGAPVVLGGDGFRPNAKVMVAIDGVGEMDTHTDSKGKFNVSMATDYDTTAGDHAVKVTAGSTVLTGAATVTEHIFHPVLSADSQVQQGETFAVTGNRFKPGEKVTLDMDGITVNTVTVNPDGMFFYGIRVLRNSPIGSHTVTARSQDGKRVSSLAISVVDRISPIISVTPVITAGGYVKVTGSGFDPNGLVWMTIPGVGTFTTMAEIDGTFGMHYGEVAYRVNTPGTYAMTLEDTNGDVLQAAFTVVPAVAVTPVDPAVSPEPLTQAPQAPVEPIAAVAPHVLAFTSQDPMPRPEAVSASVAPIDAQKGSEQNTATVRANPTPLVAPKIEPSAVSADISKVSDDISWIPYVFGGILVLVAAGGGVLVAARGRRAGDSG
ncbi:hypothetical protein [Arthrobacter sp. MI7-26]|uniref:hypothetical protein n=1 Tax=Arthrobacter sp. MI7-26 TaxID=2993653 RepID=UPI0022489D85|nr:hypothetical protein [Arthrobacter sp. MI7-26]